jgi:DNA-binding transcriptional LysR family regulator
MHLSVSNDKTLPDPMHHMHDWKVLETVQLQQFLAVSRSLNISRAAEELHVAQSTLSRSVQRLEQQLGASLLERSKGSKGVTLTEVGRRLASVAEDVLGQVGNFEVDVNAPSSHQRSILRAAMGPLFAHLLVPRLMESWLLSHASTTFEIGRPEIMLRRLAAGEIDLFVGHLPREGSPPGLDAISCGTTEYSAWVRPGHPLALTADVELDSISTFPVIAGSAWVSDVLPSFDGRIQRLLHPSLVVDEQSVLTEVVVSTDSVLLSPFGDRAMRLLRLDTGDRIPRTPFSLFIFKRQGDPITQALRRIEHELRILVSTINRST